MPEQSLAYRDGELCMDGVALRDIATSLGTPTYVYSAASMRQQCNTLRDAFAGVPTHIHYSVKANSNLSVLRLFAQLGCGFDIVSGGELTRVLSVGGDPAQVVFSGVGKSVAEIDYALKHDIACFNVESEGELERLAARAALLGKVAPVAVRVNPDVDAQTHPYISTGLKQNKFGVTPAAALEMYISAVTHPHLEVVGIDCHIGSQISSAEPLLEALDSILELVDTLEREGIRLQHIDLGGGMGVTYRDEVPLDVEAYGASVAQIMGHRTQTIFLEPGRSLTANAGVLLTRVEYLKPSRDASAPGFAVVDAAMNDLIRPALYQAWHDVLPLTEQAREPATWNIVGPICESGDFIAHDRELDLAQDTLLAVASAGAYSMSQASNYNSRPRGCEVMVDAGEFHLIRRRENIEDLLRHEVDLSGGGA